MQLFKEFREFAVKGNVIDLAVGVIIGASFGKIVTSLVDDLIMPPIAAIMNKVNFADMIVELRPERAKMLNGIVQNSSDGQPIMEKAINLNYGNFINVIVQFLIVAWAVFLMVKAINKAKARFEPAPETDEPVVKECPLCLSEIPVKAIRCKFCTADLSTAL
ncbi:MAG TPA: large conductance mechanosensitive channel protein MscL [Fimbriimonas sp.]|nr:large conductance mechanosensitive channel protein MscL [Fimbriimonas sp.]